MWLSIVSTEVIDTKTKCSHCTESNENSKFEYCAKTSLILKILCAAFTKTTQLYACPGGNWRVLVLIVVKIRKFTSGWGDIQSSSGTVFGVLSPKLFLFNSNSIWKIMKWRLAVDAAAVDNSNDSGRNWKLSIRSSLASLLSHWAQGNRQMGNMGNNGFMGKQIRLSLLSISLSLPPPLHKDAPLPPHPRMHGHAELQQHLLVVISKCKRKVSHLWWKSGGFRERKQAKKERKYI